MSEFKTSPPEVFLGKGVLIRKRCSENMQQIYRRAPLPKCDFNKVAYWFIEIAFWHRLSLANLLHIFRTRFKEIPMEGCF